MTLPTLPAVPTRTRRPTRTSISPHSQPAYKTLSRDSKAAEPVSHLVAEHGAEQSLDRSGPAPQAGLDTNLSTERIDYGSTDQQQAQHRTEETVNEPFTESLASPGHQESRDRPDSPTLATATTSAPGGDTGFSDGEESSPGSWSDEVSQDEGNHSEDYEAVAPAPHPTRYDVGSPSSYVSDTDLHDNKFTHPGETYIEKGECSGLEPLHLGLSDVENEGGAKDRLSHTPDFDESSFHLVQEVSVRPTSEPSKAPLDLPEDHARHKSEEQKYSDQEDENERLPAHESEDVNGAGQEVVVDTAGSDTVSDHDHDEATDDDNGAITHDVSEHQPTIHAVLEAKEPTLSRGGDLSLDDHIASSEHESHEPEHNEPQAHEELDGAIVSSDQHEENQPSPEHPNDRVQDAEHEEQTQHPDHGVYPSSHLAESEKDYDTDTDSQHFVTPLPSRHSLRTFSQQQQANLSHDTDDDDYIGSHDYGSDDARKHELEHQHAATVHGEAELFDDTDRSEDHTEPEDVGSERPHASQQGAPVWRSVLGHETPEADADTQALLDVETPRSPENYVRHKSWAEEVEGYFENEDEDEPESQPETPSLKPNETVHGPTESDQDSPARTDIASSEHHHERPETPAGHESLVSSEYVTPETLATRDTNSVPRRGNDGWTPQSQDTQSTFSSPPVSPVQSPAPDKSEPVPSSHPGTEPRAQHHEPQSSPHLAEQEDPFIDETDRKTPVNLMPPWNRRGSPGQASPDDSPPNEGNTGSLFQRMRNMFEQPRSNISSRDRDRDRNRDFYASSGRTRPASGAWFSQPADPPPTTQKRFSSFHPPIRTGNSTPRSPRSPQSPLSPSFLSLIHI